MDNKPTQEELRGKMKEAANLIKKEIETESEKRYCTYEKFEDAVMNYDPKKDFRPSLLCGCACPEGSISVIAARPGGGKTSSMINIVRETLMSNINPEKKKRKILYVNLEMNYKQILTNLHLSCIYDFATEEEKEELKTLKKTIFAFNNTMKKKDWKDECWVINDELQEEDELLFPVDDDLKQAFENNYRKAKELIKNSMHNNELKIYDGIGEKFENIKTEIEKQSEAGTLILLDYVQRLPATKEDTSMRYLQIQKASAELLKTAIEKQLIVITGAQLNRGTKGEPPTMGNIRESGDIEQDAHNVVILDKDKGKDNNEKDYAKVDKAREGDATAHKMAINTVKQFIFWETEGKYKDHENNDGDRKNPTAKKKKHKNARGILAQVAQRIHTNAY
jgi:replicative DNA helicase